MAVTVKHTKVVIDGDNKPVKKVYKDTKKETKDLGANLNKQFSAIGKKIAAVFGAGLIIKGLKDSARAAIDAQETFSRFGTIFINNMGAASKAVLDLRDNYGLSNVSAHDLLATTGDLLVGLGAQEGKALELSKTTQALAADISSFNNLQGGTARASEIITKAMLGERDALISLKVKISEADVKQRLMALGQADLTGKALLLAKAQATLQLITEQSGKAIGDYARTSDSAANTLKRLGNTFEDFQISIGNSIIKTEGAQGALDAIKTLLEDPAFIDALSNIASTFTSVFAAIIPILGGVLKGLSDIVSFAVTNLPKVADEIKKWMPLIGIVLQGLESLAILLSGKLAESEDAQIKTIIALNTQFVGLNDRLKEIRDNAGLASDDMRELSREMQNIEDPAKRVQAKISAIKFEELAERAKLTDVELGKIIDDFIHIEDPARRYQKILIAISRGEYDTDAKKLSTELKGLTKEYAISEEMVKGVSKETKDLSKETVVVTGLTKEQNKAIEAAKKAYEKLADSMGILTSKGIIDQSKEIKSLLKLYKENKDQILGNNEITGKWIGTIEKLAKTALPEEKKALENIATAIKLAKEEEVDFAEEADNLNTSILPKATIEFQKMEDKIKDSDKETGSLKETFTGLSTTIKNALDALSALGINLGKLPEILGAVSQGVNSIGAGLSAIKEPGKGFVDILSNISGSISIVTGAMSIFGSILSAISGPSGELEAARRRMQGLQMNTAGWGAKIEELAKQLGGADSAGRAFNALLADMIRDSDISVVSFGNYVNRVREIISTFEQGNATMAETEKNFGAAFAAISQAAQGLGIEGGAAMTGLIMLADEYGLKIKEIAEYKEKNMVSATKGWMQVLEEMGGVSIPILDEQVRLFKLLESIPPEIMSQIEGATAALTGMSNVGRVLPEDFAQFGLIVDDVKAKLAESNVFGADAAKAMKPLLEKIIFLSNEYGFSIDDSTKALIDQGVEAGHLSTDLRSDTQKQIDLQERMVNALERLTRGFGFMEDSINGVGDAAERMAGRMNDDLSQTQKNLSGIADIINTDVVSALNNMGDTSDKVMKGQSIIPDTKEWQKENEKIRNQLKNEVIPAIDAIGRNFENLFKEMVSNSEVGTKAFHKFIEKASAMGISVDIEGLKEESIQKAFESFSKIKIIGEIDTRSLKQEISNLEDELLDIKPGTIASAVATTQLDKLKQNLSDTLSAQKVFGDISIGIFNDMYEWQNKVGENKTLINGIQDTADLLGEFSKAQELTEDEFQSFEDIVARAREELKGQGFDETQIIKALAPLLEKLNILEQDYGFNIDETTKSLIAKGLKEGEISSDIRTNAEKQLELQEKQLEIWKLIAQSMGVDISGINDAIGVGGREMQVKPRTDAIDGKIPTQEEIDTVIFQSLQSEWTKNWEKIAGNQASIEALVGKLGELSVFDDMEKELNDFEQWVNFTKEQMDKGLQWDPTKLQFLQHGTVGFQPIQSAIVGEVGPEVVQVRDNEMNVTPLVRGGVSPGSPRQINFNVKITGEEALSPYRFADTLRFVIENNPNGIMDLFEEVLNE